MLVGRTPLCGYFLFHLKVFIPGVSVCFTSCFCVFLWFYYMSLYSTIRVLGPQSEGFSEVTLVNSLNKSLNKMWRYLQTNDGFSCVYNREVGCRWRSVEVGGLSVEVGAAGRPRRLVVVRQRRKWCAVLNPDSRFLSEVCGRPSLFFTPFLFELPIFTVAHTFTLFDSPEGFGVTDTSL